MNSDQRLKDLVYQVITAVVAGGQPQFKPGHVADALRAADEPMGTWQLRALLTALESDGLLVHNDVDSTWSVATRNEQAASG